MVADRVTMSDGGPPMVSMRKITFFFLVPPGPLPSPTAELGSELTVTRRLEWFSLGLYVASSCCASFDCTRFDIAAQVPHRIHLCQLTAGCRAGDSADSIRWNNLLTCARVHHPGASWVGGGLGTYIPCFCSSKHPVGPLVSAQWSP